jgi:hypothetical protein
MTADRHDIAAEIEQLHRAIDRMVRDLTIHYAVIMALLGVALVLIKFFN